MGVHQISLFFWASLRHLKHFVPTGWNVDLTVDAFQSTSKQALESLGAHFMLLSQIAYIYRHLTLIFFLCADTAAVCEEWVSHPVLVTQRDTFANFFHDSEDFFNVFIAMAVLDYMPGQVQMYLTDLYPKGPFW